MAQIVPSSDGLPKISGFEEIVAHMARQPSPPRPGAIDLTHATSACAIALHMHQPLVPAGGDDLGTAALVSNLDYMFRHQGEGDNHNAGTFRHCYERLGEFIPQLVREGKSPRVMLDYSGTLLYGLELMGASDVFDALKTITLDPAYAACVEWLGCAWGHAVAPSTPVQDYRLHVQAWQGHFASIFGLGALGRVRGFSPAEMALPNHPDVAYEFVRTLLDCGFQWVLVQEHSVEQPEDGWTPQRKHLPHRLVCRNSTGEEASIVAIIKTQGSDSKLVAQMQPYYEAKGLGRAELAGQRVPQLVTQVADGENGGVMMNEFPGKYFEVVRESSSSATPLVNVSEYLDYLTGLGIGAEDLPELVPLHQRKVWQRMDPGDGPEKLEQVISELRREDHRFHMEGGSWTNNLSWVKGYDNVLGPLDRLSVHFAETIARVRPRTDERRYRNALFHLLTAQTSCYRYWGQGRWTDYAREICRRGEDILKYDF
jgi:hypothetical protein